MEPLCTASPMQARAHNFCNTYKHDIGIVVDGQLDLLGDVQERDVVGPIVAPPRPTVTESFPVAIHRRQSKVHSASGCFQVHMLVYSTDAVVEVHVNPYFADAVCIEQTQG